MEEEEEEWWLGLIVLRRRLCGDYVEINEALTMAHRKQEYKTFNIVCLTFIVFRCLLLWFTSCHYINSVVTAITFLQSVGF